MQVVYLPDINRINPQPPFLPQAIPRELADKLFTFHGKPFAWFAGQLFSYLSRPNEELKRYFAERRKSVNITKPYVGYVLYGITVNSNRLEIGFIN